MRAEPVGDALIRALHAQRSALLGPRFDRIDDFYVHNVALASAREKMLHGLDATIAGRTYRHDQPSDRKELDELIVSARARAEGIELAAVGFRVERRYMRLMWTLVTASTVFVVAVVAFAVLTRNSTPRASVTAPREVIVYIPTGDAAREAGLKQECVGQTLSGVAVGGTFDEPLIVTRPTSQCPASRVRSGSAMVVVPVATMTPTPTAAPSQRRLRD